VSERKRERERARARARERAKNIEKKTWHRGETLDGVLYRICSP
jgi:hypothetical protein